MRLSLCRLSKKIRLSWLRVDKATRVFRSEVVKDKTLETARVHKTKGNRSRTLTLTLSPLNFSNKNKPAVTKVEECTKEETGVGALIAAGSQTLKGNWALLVILVNTSRILRPAISITNPEGISNPNLKIKNKDNSIIKNTSPSRLEKTVILEDSLLEGFK